jgi:hypothetical protein
MAAIFLAAERNEWDSLTLLEHRTDRERTRRVFEEANVRFTPARFSRSNAKFSTSHCGAGATAICRQSLSALPPESGHLAHPFKRTDEKINSVSQFAKFV